MPSNASIWCTGEDSNLRSSEERQIYSLLPLTTRSPVRRTEPDRGRLKPLRGALKNSARFALALRSRSNDAHCMLRPALLFKGSAAFRASPSRFARAIPALTPRSPDLLAHKRALFPVDKSDLRDARTYFRINRQILTLGEVFVGLPSGRKLLMCAQCLLCRKTRPAYALPKIPFCYLELAKGLEPPTL